MLSCIAIGETIYDIIFRQGQPVAARAGGSMLNTAVSLGRSGINTAMVTELGDDLAGRLILDFLDRNGVTTSCILPASGLKTPISLAFLDQEGNAHYSFYKQYPENRLNVNWPDTEKGDIVLFGSFYSLDLAIREKIVTFIKKAKDNQGLIIYDPNIRKNHLDEIRNLMPLVEENIALADIVRGSDEDFMNLFGIENAGKIFERIKILGCPNLILTRGKNGAELFAKSLHCKIPAKEIHVLSTIGAGDAFNAGIIFGLINKGYSVDDLVNIDLESWNDILGYGINFSAEVCKSYDNYIPVQPDTEKNPQQ